MPERVLASVREDIVDEGLAASRIATARCSNRVVRDDLQRIGQRDLHELIGDLGRNVGEVDNRRVAFTNVVSFWGSICARTSCRMRLHRAAYSCGLMFWFRRKKLVGSYVFFSATSRS